MADSCGTTQILADCRKGEMQEMNNKYPYIADKRMYAAVMSACNYIRETGYFNKAVSYCADKYGVKEEELAKQIRKRQAAGQRGKTRKYKYYIVEEYKNYQYRDNYEPHTPQINNFKIIRATSRKNAENYEITGYGYQNESYVERIRNVIGEYDTKIAAEEALKNEMINRRRGV